MIQFIPKLKQFGNSIFSTMSALAAEQRAINLSQGFPDFLPEETVRKSLAEAAMGEQQQYAPAAGNLLLRELLAEKYANTYQANYHPADEITITAGATMGIYTAITALIHPGDEVIVFSPCYDSYIPAIELMGGKVISYTLEAPNFSVDWNNFKKIITSKTRLIIINSPHNPTGSIFSLADLKELEKMLAGTNVFLLSDEVYEHIVYDGFQHHSLASLSAIKDQVIVVSSFGKTYHTTGWKLGYILAEKNVTEAIRKVHQYFIFSVSTPTQVAFENILKNQALIAEATALYQAKKDFFVDAMKASRFSLLPVKGTYFVVADYSKISSEPDVDFAITMTKEEKVATIPVSVFYTNKLDQKLIRFCFAKKEETLKRALDKLIKI